MSDEKRHLVALRDEGGVHDRQSDAQKSMPKPPPRSAWRLTCCLCAKPIPPNDEVYALDREWRRRHPRIGGVLACSECALGNTHHFECSKTEPVLHVEPWGWRARRVGLRDGRPRCDAWHHIRAHGDQEALVAEFPQSGLVQGGRPYVEYIAGLPEADPIFKVRALHALGLDRQHLHELVAFFDRDLEESQDYSRVSAQYPSGVLLENDRVTLAVSAPSSTWALHQVLNEIVALGLTAQLLAIKSGDDPTVSGDI